METVTFTTHEVPLWVALTILGGLVLGGVLLVWVLLWMFWPKRHDD
jgi:hypothetical protein